MKVKNYFNWAFSAPLLAFVFFFSGLLSNPSIIYTIIGAVFLIVGVITAVHHAEVVALKVGDPFGTIILAVSITILEVAIIISLMIAGGEHALSYARDTLFAAVMLILTGIIGLSMLIGGLKFHEQSFTKSSATASLVSLVVILVITFILPNFTSTVDGPFYSKSQMLFVSLACLIIYVTFVTIQTTRYRKFFTSVENEVLPDDKPSNFNAYSSLVFLILCLGIVVLLAKALSPSIENFVETIGAPNSLVGVIIAAVVLLPEGLTAIRLAARDNMQSSLNLSLGSALACIGLSIPAVVGVCLYLNLPIVLGIDAKSFILLGLTIFATMLSLARGKTNILYGIVLLVILATYIFTILVP